MHDQETESVLAEVRTFDSEYKPEPPRRPGVDSLKPGAYEFQIVTALCRYMGDRKTPALVCQLKVMSGTDLGLVIEKPWWLSKPEAVNRLGTDLAALGLDADQWTAANGKSFSAELAKAIPSLVGMKFRGKVVQVQDNTYLNVLGPVRGSAMPAPPVVQHRTSYHPAPPPSADEADIPF